MGIAGTLSAKESYFAHGQFFFEGEFGIKGGDDELRSAVEDQSRTSLNSPIPASVAGMPGPLGSVGQLRNAWFEIAARYMRCDLPVERDKLPAVSGLARHIEEATRE